MGTISQQKVDRDLQSVQKIISYAQNGDADHYAGKRRAPRFAEGIPLEMTEDLSRKSFGVSMHNISATGCAFWIKRQLTIHSVVYVREFTSNDSAMWIPGYVTHCTQGIRGYLIGVAFGDPP